LLAVGHYALTLQWSFLGTWYLLILYEKERLNKWMISGFIGLITFVLMRMHVYLGMMSLLFVLFGTLATYILKWKENFNVPEISRRAIQIGVPIIFQLVLLSTDMHERTQPDVLNTEHKAILAHFFLSNYGISKSFYQLFIDYSFLKKYSWSAIGNYIGITAMASILVWLSRGLITRVGKKTQDKVIIPQSIFMALIASIALAIYAMAIPHELIKVVAPHAGGPLKQLHAMGRFGWPFYYVVNVFAAIYFYRVLKNKKLHVLWFCLLFLIPVAEGFRYHTLVAERMAEYPNYFSKEEMPSEIDAFLSTGAIDPDKYQAIITLPFDYMYFSQYQTSGSDETKRSSMLLSYYTGLPTMNTILSRPSSKESMEMKKFIHGKPSEAFIAKFHPTKPILLYYTRENLTENQKRILEKGKLVYENIKIQLYELAPPDL